MKRCIIYCKSFVNIQPMINCCIKDDSFYLTPEQMFQTLDIMENKNADKIDNTKNCNDRVKSTI